MPRGRRWYAGWATVWIAAACSGADLTLPAAREPATLEILSGDQQRAPAGALLGEPLRVRVLDVDGRPLRGAAVEFKFLGTLPGAGLDPEIAESDDSGQAGAMVRLASIVGEQVVVASLVGSGAARLRVTFRAMALASANPDGGSGNPGSGGGSGSGSTGGGSSGSGAGGSTGSSGGGSGTTDGGLHDMPPPGKLGIPLGQLPPPGSCRVWFLDRPAGQQPAPESCNDALDRAPRGTWVLERARNRPDEVKVYVMDAHRAGIVVQVWVYDAHNGSFLREDAP